jgi:hypothetical protein
LFRTAHIHLSDGVGEMYEIERDAYRDGKVRFGPVLQGIFENPEPDYWFGPQIMANLGLDRWFGPKRSGSGSQGVRTTNRTLSVEKGGARG